jgi:alpha-L-fucosidase 2
MLLQSHGQAGVIQVLPALPDVWKTGSFNGLCARGAFEINLKWKDRKAVEARVLSKAGNQFRFKGKDGMKVSCKAKPVGIIYNQQENYYYFETAKDCFYTIRFR